MPCSAGRNCTDATKFEIESHGMAVGLCERHEKQAVNAVTGDVGLSDENLVHDYVRIYALLNSKELFYKAMKTFSTEVSRAEKKRLGKSTWFNRDKVAIHLNYSLSRYEGLCWFGTQQKIMSGLLTAEEFTNAIVNGFMVKDPGPGSDHGEYSHRLQWHYIMRVVTDKFSRAKTSDWKLTPLQQYSGTMGARNVWGALLEGNGNTFMNGCPGDPAWVNRQFREHDVLKSTSFGTTLTRRYDRRVGLETKVADMLTSRGYKVELIPTGRIAADKVRLHGVLEYLYKWKKAGRVEAPLPAALGTEPREKTAAEELWADVFERKYRNSRRQFRRAAYVDPDDDTRIIVSDGLLLHRSESVTDAPLVERLASSRGGLNPAYRYSSSLGAKRVKS
ncbi:MAG: hypothetical protein NXI31_16010 [bacterium]|nr:hypothetical protein [bacterium]